MRNFETTKKWNPQDLETHPHHHRFAQSRMEYPMQDIPETPRTHNKRGSTRTPLRLAAELQNANSPIITPSPEDVKMACAHAQQSVTTSRDAQLRLVSNFCGSFFSDFFPNLKISLKKCFRYTQSLLRAPTFTRLGRAPRPRSHGTRTCPLALLQWPGACTTLYRHRTRLRTQLQYPRARRLRRVTTGG